MKPRVLIASVSTGAGHLRAAEAVEAALHINHPNLKVMHVNAMHYVSKPFRRIYEDSYAFMVNRAPSLWASVYGATDRRKNNPDSYSLLNSFQSLNASALFECIERFEPHRILTTHFFLPHILSARIRARRFHVPLECVITDFDLHRSWVDSCVSHYYVAREKVAIKLVREGINREKITVSGIPIHPDFLKATDKSKILTKMGLHPHVPTLLVLSGGLGFGALEKTVKHLLKLKSRVQIITVAGKNEEKLKRLNALQPPSHISLVNYGYVTNMAELIACSDMVVTKAGGLTISECLAQGAAIIIYGSIPGQEQKNSAYVKLKGAAVEAENVDDLLLKVQSFLEVPEVLHRFRHNARECGKPQAAFNVADSLASHLH